MEPSRASVNDSNLRFSTVLIKIKSWERVNSNVSIRWKNIVFDVRVDEVVEEWIPNFAREDRHQSDDDSAIIFDNGLANELHQIGEADESIPSDNSTPPGDGNEGMDLDPCSSSTQANAADASGRVQSTNDQQFGDSFLETQRSEPSSNEKLNEITSTKDVESLVAANEHKSAAMKLIPTTISNTDSENNLGFFQQLNISTTSGGNFLNATKELNSSAISAFHYTNNEEGAVNDLGTMVNLEKEQPFELSKGIQLPVEQKSSPNEKSFVSNTIGGNKSNVPQQLNHAAMSTIPCVNSINGAVFNLGSMAISEVQQTTELSKRSQLALEQKSTLIQQNNSVFRDIFQGSKKTNQKTAATLKLRRIRKHTQPQQYRYEYGYYTDEEDHSYESNVRYQ